MKIALLSEKYTPDIGGLAISAGRLAKLLTNEQNRQVRDMRQGRRRGGPGGIGERRPPDDIYRWEVHSIDRKTGQTIWKKLALEGKPRIPTQRSNTYATETPVSDGERVYAYFAMHGLFCYVFCLSRVPNMSCSAKTSWTK